MPPQTGGIHRHFTESALLLFLLLALALLICDAAAGLAGRLTGSLALAAAALLRAFAEISGLNGLNVTHLLGTSLPENLSVSAMRTQFLPHIIA